MGDDVHAQRHRRTCHQPPHVADPHDAQGLAQELGTPKPGTLPAPALDGCVGGGDAARHREHQAHGKLGGGLRIGAGRVHHEDAPFRGRRYIDVVHAGPGATDHPQFGPGLYHPAIDGGLGAHQKCRARGDRTPQLVGSQTVALHHLDPGITTQLLHPLRGNRLRHQHTLHVALV